jgi:hypothetical protein
MADLITVQFWCHGTEPIGRAFDLAHPAATDVSGGDRGHDVPTRQRGVSSSPPGKRRW